MNNDIGGVGNDAGTIALKGRRFGVWFFRGIDDELGCLLSVNEEDPTDWDSLPAVFGDESEAVEFAEKAYATLVEGADDWKAFASVVVEVESSADGWVAVNDPYEQCFGEAFSACELCGDQVWLNCNCVRCLSCEELNTETTTRGKYRERCGHCGAVLEGQEV